MRRDAFSVMMESTRRSSGRRGNRTTKEYQIWYRRPLIFLAMGYICAVLLHAAEQEPNGGEAPATFGLAKSSGAAPSHNTLLSAPVIYLKIPPPHPPGGETTGAHSTVIISSPDALSPGVLPPPTKPGKLEIIGKHAATRSEDTIGAEGDPNEPFWIVFVAYDGLGNQMFQYASALGMMLSNANSEIGKKRYIMLCHHIRQDSNHEFLLSEIFGGPFSGLCPAEVPGLTCGSGCSHWHLEKGFATYTPLNLNGFDGDGDPYSKRPGAFVARYLQSFKYFDGDIKYQVKELFQFRNEIKSEAISYLNELKTMQGEGPVTVVGIHFRRGDLLAENRMNFPPFAYFPRAMEQLSPSDSKTIFITVGSKEDLDWVKVQSVFQQPNVFYSESVENEKVLDLALLANCDHVITTIGTFGWWAGWLSGGTVIYYKDQFNMKHPVHHNKIILEDYFPKEWIGLTNVGLGLEESDK